MKRLSMIAVVFALSVIPLSASASYEFYVVVDGGKQGKFRAECTQAAWKDAMKGVDFRYEVTSPTDAGTGAATGKRQHKPIVITKALGPSAPQFLQALVTNELLKQVVISFVQRNGAGEEEVVYTIKLTNARVLGYVTRVGTVEGDPRLQLLEDITIVFARIDVEHKVGKTMAFDDTTK
ncbi:MAG: type VI secretion system tube protein Hcp [Proteobacteria bacterium]|jgi:type VI secretion system secreted protein Hcp|nr:type VI secretion system tube protein Hcp [Pseudomonadota bacterium]